MNSHLAIIVTGIHNEGIVTWALEVGAGGLRKQGIDTLIFRMNWQTNKDYKAREKELLALIIQKSKIQTVSLVGISAGATASLNVFAQTDKVQRVVSMCGWINPKAPSKNYTKRLDLLNTYSPSFDDAVKELDNNVPKLPGKLHNVLAFRGRSDEFIPPEVAVLPGVEVCDLKTWFHVLTISYGLVGYSRQIADFVQAKTVSN